MGLKKILGWICKAPLILLILATVGVGFYAASGSLPGFKISYAAPLIIIGLIVLYLLGVFLCSGNNNDIEVVSENGQNETNNTNSDYDEETQRAIEQYESEQ